MPFIKYIERIRYIDTLVRKKCTGDLKCLSKKLLLSKSAVSETLRDMKELGFPIKYSKARKSYFYKESGRMTDHFFQKDLSDQDLRQISGGQNYFEIFLEPRNAGM
ncbi:MAG: hypothetical protein JSS98_03945 [Bacteroidetes bacterium]|nr:hypothetical protein [Bacteroidota bacterium]